MIIHLFNSSSVSGPERLVLPALARHAKQFSIVNLKEKRISRLDQTDPLQDFSRSLGLPYESVPVHGRWDKTAMSALGARLAALRPKLVHAHAIKASIYLVHATRRDDKPTFPIVTTHHGVKGLPDWKYRAYEWWYRKRYLNRFDQVLAVSTEDYGILQGSGVRPQVLRLHLNGAAGCLVRPEDRVARSLDIRRTWFPHDANRESLVLFGVVARLSREKDHSRLFAILAELKRLREAADWKCLLFGDGALRETLTEEARHLGINDQIVWMGYRPQVGDELAGLDLLLSFSRAEGLPINLVEAGWAATPVLATRVGGVKDLLTEERFGVAIPLEEPVSVTAQRLADMLTPAGREKARTQGEAFQKNILKGFTQDAWLEKLRALYAELHVEVDAH